MPWQQLFKADVIVLAIPIVAIVVAGIVVIVKVLISHRERMAMIERGMHPDQVPEDDDNEEE